MNERARAINDAIEASCPPLYAALSSLGRRVVYPQDIPFQAAEARGKTYNGTIGQITDGRGGAIMLPAMEAAMSGMPAADRNRAFLYSPVEGIADVRHAWRRWQRRDQDEARPSSLPVVTVGLSQGLAVAADLFGGEGRAVAVPRPFWGNYRQTWEVRGGARLVSAPALRDGRFNAAAFAQALEGLSEGEPAVAILNLPSNPGGYSPTVAERRELTASLVAIAEDRPLVVVCDDAYLGLVFEPDVPRGSMFWELNGAHPNLVPVKVDGATKEFSFFGGRVGFITFPFAPESAIAGALESKAKCLVRAMVGSPAAASQMILHQALVAGDVGRQVESVHALLEPRYRALKAGLAGVDPELLRPLPFNSGCFALVELGERVAATADQVRRHLLEHHDTGVVSIEDRYLRIAFCSVTAEALPELVRRVEKGAAELAR